MVASLTESCLLAIVIVGFEREGGRGAKLTKLAKLTVGDDERAQSLQAIKSLVAMLLRRVFVDWRAWHTCAAAINVLCLPRKVLEQVVGILGEEKVLCLLDDIAEILHQSLAFCRELLRWVGHELLVDERVEGDIDLRVRWNLAALESCTRLC